MLKNTYISLGFSYSRPIDLIVRKNGELMHMHKLLDCTLRDGSYAVDFQFTTTDTENIVQIINQKFQT